MEIFKKIALSQMPRILGLGDREQSSATFGCFDRYYWHYKLHDISNIRFQEAAKLLSLLYKCNFMDNIYYGNGSVSRWITGSVEFWARCQHNNGSFDEVYPHEQSFCATSFSTLAVSEACLLMGIGQKHAKAFCRAGRWLAASNNMEVANQMAAAAAALYNIFMITGDDYFRKKSREKIARLMSMQDENGCFYEYGWGDIGYQTITLSILSEYYEKTQAEEVNTGISAGINWLRPYINEDGSFDASGMSRQTQYIYVSPLIDRGKDILAKVKTGLCSNRIVSPSWMDDRYVIPMTIDYLKAYIVNEACK